MMKRILAAGAFSWVLVSSGEAALSGRSPEVIPVPPGANLPQWPKPVVPELPADAPSVRSQELELIHSRDASGGFVIRVAGTPFAMGQDQGLVGYVLDRELRWIDIAHGSNHTFSVKSGPNALTATFECSDPEGGRWRLDQQFNPGSIPGALDIRTEVSVDQDRAVAFLPMLMLFPGAGTFGSTKGQGLLAGLEYLENEPSSSEADVRGPASKRQVPDNLKLTFPLMVLQNEGRYLALTWQMRPQFCAVYDSPDRIFGSGGHVMGLLFPGSDSRNREEGSLLPRSTETLHARQVLNLRATVLGGSAQSVVPAVQQYVRLRGLPPLPPAGLDLQQYISRTAGGWLDSKLREGNLFRHAIAGDNFKPGHAADAALWMDWLARQSTDTNLSVRLQETARGALDGIPPQELNLSGVGHVRYPVASLVFGHVPETAAQADESGHALLSRFELDFSVRYRPRAGGPDYSSTHSSKEANGLTSRAVLDLLEAAAFSGKAELIAEAINRLRAMDKFRDGVPRGAQTWECPLHTPDILASAQMVRAYTLGYELTGEPAFLEQARYWAWTGLPFVYLVNPTPQTVGLYSTIAVFGATQWKAPIWLGLPVQWCGLVYADALYRLAPHDPKGPWKNLADGITAAGIQQSWPSDDTENQGLLPDSFVLRTQHRNGPAINPATVQACAVRYFGQSPIYDFWSFRKTGIRLHAPGAIKSPRETPGGLSFEVQSWVAGRYYVYLNGLTRKPGLKLNGQVAELAPPHHFLSVDGRLILQLEGNASVELSF